MRLAHEEAFGKIAVRVDAAVSQEGPVGAGELDFGEVAIDDANFFAVDAGAVDDLAVGLADEALTPELQAVFADAFA